MKSNWNIGEGGRLTKLDVNKAAEGGVLGGQGREERDGEGVHLSSLNGSNAFLKMLFVSRAPDWSASYE